QPVSLEERAGIQNVVAEAFEKSSVQLIGPGLQAEADHGRLDVSIFGGESALDQVELLHRVYRHGKLGERTEVSGLSRGQSVDENVGAHMPPAIDRETRRGAHGAAGPLLAAQHAGRQKREVRGNPDA